MFFAKNKGKNLSNNYSQKRIDNAKKSTTDAIKTASKRAVKKTVEAAGDLIGNKIADKITSVSIELHSKNSSKELYSENEDKIELPKRRYISLEKDSDLLIN